MPNTIFPTRVTTSLAIAIAMTISYATPASALTDDEKCGLAKMKASRSYVACRIKADEKAVKTAETADYTRCDDKIGAAFAKADAKFGSECLAEGTVETLQDSLTAEARFVSATVAGVGFPPRRILLTPQEICTVAINYHGVATTTINPDYCAIAADESVGTMGRFDENLCDMISDFGGCTNVCTPTDLACPNVAIGALIKASGF